MRLSQFIQENLESILIEWETFARSLFKSEEMPSTIILRDHARLILLAISKDIERAQSEAQREAKAKGIEDFRFVSDSSAATHGALRQLVGFDLGQLTAEYRTLRATVLKRWKVTLKVIDASILEEMTRFNESIDQALSESVVAYSERVSNSRDTFLAVLGHDLRGPLSAVRACLEITGRKNSTAAQIAAASQIGKRGVAATKDLITDLLEYTRSRLGKGIEVVPKPGDLSAVCQDTLDEIRAANPTRALTSKILSNVETEFDKPRIRQVLHNLLGNALQHGDPKFPVELSLRIHGKKIEVAVINQGEVIPPEALLVIFNPLVQAPKTNSGTDERPTTSLGLGLYIAREIASGHGGTISVKSSAHHGTIFTLRLPHKTRMSQ